jgi:hypothetical protein
MSVNQPNFSKQDIFDSSKDFDTVCPFLGLPGDPDTRYLYANSANSCHKFDHPRAITLDYQLEYCLTQNFEQCYVYLEKNQAAPLTEETVEKQPRRIPIWLLAGALVIVLLAGAFLVTTGFDPGGDSILPSVPPTSIENPTSEPAEIAGEVPPTPTALPLPTQTPTPVPSDTPAPTLTPTEIPPPSETPFPTPGPGLETPFGDEIQYVIHVVQPGESYTRIGENFSTSPEVLERVNFAIEGTSLWVGRAIVVPIGVDDASSLPVFQVVFVESASSIEQLAAAYQSNADLLRSYNGLEQDQVPAGRWLIVPLVEP